MNLTVNILINQSCKWRNVTQILVNPSEYWNWILKLKAFVWYVQLFIRITRLVNLGSSHICITYWCKSMLVTSASHTDVHPGLLHTHYILMQIRACYICITHWCRSGLITYALHKDVNLGSLHIYLHIAVNLGLVTYALHTAVNQGLFHMQYILLYTGARYIYA